jgi:hypothetical protein
LEKGILVFPKLTTLRAKDTVHFYDKLQELSAGYLLPLMPFDVIRLNFNFEGLFVPGLGTECYADCAAALMEVLPRLIPTLDSEVQVAILAVRGESKNGYNLFWHMPKSTSLLTSELARTCFYGQSPHRNTPTLSPTSSHMSISFDTRTTTASSLPTSVSMALPI